MLLPPTLVHAGPVPGVETIIKTPVEFSHPEHLDVWSIGEDEYLVTFRWTPEEPVEKPGVVGSFNRWDRADLPMEGPDENGTYSVTAKIPGGDWIYKYISGDDGWHQDPHNPDGVDDGHSGQNSILRLGISALIHGMECKTGDGKVESRAFKHNTQEYMYFDVYSPTDATLRFRTLKGDAEGAEITLIAQDGEKRTLPMDFAASDAMFDYFEFNVHLSGSNKDNDFVPVAYRLQALDSGAVEADPKTYPLILDQSRIFHTPDWAQDAIWYQIMVDRFRDGDPKNNPEETFGGSTVHIDITHPWTSDWWEEKPWETRDGKTFWDWAVFDRLYGGDFEGVIKELDYLKKLGVNAIYFNPIFESHNSHKYNARSFVFADDGYGVAGEFDKSIDKIDLKDASTWFFNKSDEKFLELIKEAHKRDMKVIIDGVFNHLGDDAIPFLDVKKNGKDSQFADWYDIKSWEPFEYEGWGGFGGLPQFKKDPAKGLADDTLTQHIFDITRRWMDPNGDGDPSDGIDGWRLDVPFDVPMPFWVKWREVVKSVNPDAYLTGEIWWPAEDWLDGTKFDAVMNYEFSKSAFRYFGNVEEKTTASQFDRELARLRIRYPRTVTYVLQNLYDSHDTDRWVSRLANPDMAYDGGNRIQDNGPDYDASRPSETEYQRQKLMAIFQSTYVGAPMIWYGTEVGMFGADDPMCRQPMWWKDLMPYENEDYIIRDDTFETFKKLFHLRQDCEVLRRGDFKTLLTLDEQDVYGYLRYTSDSDVAVAVILNNSDEAQQIELPEVSEYVLPKGYKNLKVLFNMEGAGITESKDRVLVNLPPISGIVVRISR